MIGAFNLQLLEAGYDGLPQAPWTKYGIYNLLTLLIILVGTIASITYALKSNKEEG